MKSRIVIIENQMWAVMDRQDGRTVCRPGTQEALAQKGYDNKCGHCHIVAAFPTSVIDGMEIVLPEGTTVDAAFDAFTKSLRDHKVEFTAF